MKEPPLAILETFERIKSEYPFIVYLRKVNNHYYIYRQFSKAEYIGRIDNKGVFIKKLTFPIENISTVTKTDLIETLDTKDFLILKILSMNALLPLNYISKLVSMPIGTLESRIKSLEAKFGIKYFAELDVEKLGYLKYLIIVKFKDKIPTIDELKSACERDPRVQLAILIKGSSDLIIYALGRSTDGTEPIDIITSLRRCDELIRYEAEWIGQPFYEHFGTVPLRPDFFKVLETRIFKRTKKNQKPKPEDIFRSQFIIMKEMAVNGELNFSEIERKYNLPKGSAKHTFTRLKENGFIKRITISMTKLPIKYTSVFFRNIIDEKKFVAVRKDFLNWIIGDTEYPTNKFSLAGDTITPDGAILFMPVFNELEANKELQKPPIDKLLGMRSVVDIATAVITGAFCYRYFDVAHSIQHKKLREKYNVQERETLDYENIKVIKEEQEFEI